MAKSLDSDDLLPYDNQVGGHKFTKEKPLLGLYNIKKCLFVILAYNKLYICFSL